MSTQDLDESGMILSMNYTDWAGELNYDKLTEDMR